VPEVPKKEEKPRLKPPAGFAMGWSARPKNGGKTNDKEEKSSSSQVNYSGFGGAAGISSGYPQLGKSRSSASGGGSNGNQSHGILKRSSTNGSKPPLKFSP
jgi:hypothetical protein